jgi:N6-L-threonylcarbamoyladenine synthase
VIVLGIESSCDETACAVVRDRIVLSSIVASQHDLHAEYGGVVPEIASRAHAERVVPIVDRAIAESGTTLADIEGIAVTNRPGLIGALLVGVAGAKGLAWSLGVPLIGIDHLHAHLYAPLLDRPDLDPEDLFPALGLVVSGGHTDLYLMRSAGEIERIGATIDDAAGEAFDKAAAMLGLGHPGGPRIEALARGGNDRAHDFPISRLAKDSLDFSFSGLKTSVLYAIRGQPGPHGVFTRDHTAMLEAQKADIAASFQRAVAAALALKVRRALDAIAPVRAILVGGGVIANTRIRAELESVGAERNLPVVMPPMAYCVDNAAMIAGLGAHLLGRGERDPLSLSASPTSRGTGGAAR